MSETLYRYVSGELGDAEAAAFEDELFRSPQRAAEATQLLALFDGLRSLAADGGLVPIITRAEADAFAAAHRVLDYAPVPGRNKLTDQDFVVGRIPVALADAERIDVWFCTAEGHPYFVVREAPFDPDCVTLVCKSHIARAAGTIKLRIVDQDQKLRTEVTLTDLV